MSKSLSSVGRKDLEAEVLRLREEVIRMSAFARWAGRLERAASELPPTNWAHEDEAPRLDRAMAAVLAVIAERPGD